MWPLGALLGIRPAPRGSGPAGRTGPAPARRHAGAGDIIEARRPVLNVYVRMCVYIYISYVYVFTMSIYIYTCVSTVMCMCVRMSVHRYAYR